MGLEKSPDGGPTQPGTLKGPIGVAIDKQGYLLVTDGCRNVVQVWSSDGDFLCEFGSFGAEKGQFNSPHGIAVCPITGVYYIADSANNRIQIWTPGDYTQTPPQKPKFSCMFGKKGKSNGELSNPFGIAIDKQGRVVVVDFGNRRIQVFDERGDYLSQFGTETAENPSPSQPYPYEWKSPVSVTIDEDNTIILCDSSLSKSLFVFSPTGNHLRGIGYQNQFSGPTSVWVHDKQLFVVDSKNNQIQVLTSETSTLLPSAMPTKNGPAIQVIDAPYMGDQP